MTRLFIYTKDVQVLTGKSERTALRIIAAIKNQFKKARHQHINVLEFSEYMGVRLEFVLEKLR